MIPGFLNKMLTLFSDECEDDLNSLRPSRKSPRFKLFKSGKPSLQEPPERPGLYRLLRKDTGEIWYIGQASKLKTRINQHKQSKKEVEWVAAWKEIGTCFTEDAYKVLKQTRQLQKSLLKSPLRPSYKGSPVSYGK